MTRPITATAPSTDTPPHAARVTVAPERHHAPIDVKLGGDDRLWGVVQDLSVTGIRINAAFRPAVGEHVEAALMWGLTPYSCRMRVVRHTDEGLAVEYVGPSDGFMRLIRDVLARSPLVHDTPDAVLRGEAHSAPLRIASDHN